MIENAPDFPVMQAHQLAHGTNRHLFCQHNEQSLHQETEAAAGARPWNGNLLGLATFAATDTGQIGMDKRCGIHSKTSLREIDTEGTISCG